ncbi:hypothetical protein MJO28_012314 [Puccinia striiformis f. sp. tritici]|uniref:Uncharacterized protein n=4 Tax=Puccinia striiformis TaxID=27350 RepID=A0A0L0V920_9BASI|nr:hypothetical protein Pst134EA_022807 [Puccinia striiformis f. sp. tritici]KAI9612281.1 hypothetical protein KEM48_004297 [Puccinia striiformis f. sp. tritici PST-130]KNE95696.1 hypothetical protein PSTG_10915 [Puccinia striiformis f. sp. tritici PST-78]POW04643.1 hypothetical protein PSTT_10250 [Puccinia striiformis]KAH9445829.1 hypothetical protein Pst134EB_023662 [Puccinia striiformis f. sp. tritici]KAH9455337.1 hypothetical protein Pst134EA_022807 [Puccinia striiformis f. sp. tritici]
MKRSVHGLLIWLNIGMTALTEARLTRSGLSAVDGSRITSDSTGNKHYDYGASSTLEDEDAIWRLLGDHNDPDYSIPDTSESIVTRKSARKNTGSKLSTEGVGLRRQFDQVSTSSKDIESTRKQKRIRRRPDHIQHEALEVNQRSSGSKATVPDSTPSSNLAVDWGIVWDELISFDDPLPRQIGIQTAENRAPSHSQPIQGVVQEIPQVGREIDEFDRMLWLYRPKGLPSPLVGIAQPTVLESDITMIIDSQTDFAYTQLARHYVHKYQPAIKKMSEYEIDEDFWMSQAPLGGLILGSLHSEKEKMAMMVPMNPSGIAYDNESLASVLIELHKNTIHAHGLLWKRLEGAALDQPDLEKFEFWLLGETCKPIQGLPVFGRFFLTKSEDRTYAIVQDWMAKYLVGLESASTTSLAILGIWFKNTRPDQWHSSFNSDNHFWEQALQLLRGNSPDTVSSDSKSEESLTTKPKRPKRNDHFNHFVDEDPEKVKIGNFQLLDMRIDPPHLPKPTGRKAMMSWMTAPHMWGFEKELTGPGWKLIDRFSAVAISELAGGQVPMKFYRDSGVMLTRHHGNIGENGMLAVRILNKDKRRLVHNHRVKEKLKTLLRIMEISAIPILEKYAALSLHDQLDPRSLPSVNGFFDWFSTKLFGVPEGPFFPIFGSVHRSALDRFPAPNFDEVQKFTIRHLNDDSQFKNLEGSATLLGYWLKNHNQSFWNLYIGDDKNYCEFIINALPSVFTKS